MRNTLNHINQPEGIAALRDLSKRLQSNTEYSYIYRGSEGNSLRAQARQSLRWHQLFHTMNRRAQA